PVPAVAAPRAAAGLAPRAPGDHRRRERAPAGPGGGRHPPPPGQRHLRAARPAAGPISGGGQVSQPESMLVVSAHAADFVWRAGGAVALAAARGGRVMVLCLSYGERGATASAWRAGDAAGVSGAQPCPEASRATAP